MSPSDEGSPPTRMPVGVALRRFQTTLDAARELLESVTPHAESLDQSRFATTTLAAIEGLTPDRQERLAAFFQQLRDRTASKSRDKSLDGPPDAPAETNPNGISSTSPPDDDDDQAPELPADHPFRIDLTPAMREELNEIFGDNPAAVTELLLVLYREMVSPSRVDMLNEALLTMSVAAFENFVAALIAESYLSFPETLDGDQKEFSLAELVQMGTLDEVREAAIASRVEGVMRKSLDEWQKWFLNKHAIDLATICDLQLLDESLQRRHAIVHNDGRVSYQYLRRVPSAPESLKVGDRLYTKRDYVAGAIDDFYSTGTILGTICWRKWLKNEAGPAANFYSQATYELMQSDRWTAVERLTRLGLEYDLFTDDEDRLVLQCNHWLALKRLHGRDAIEEQISNWDTSALSRRFRFAHRALLDDLDGLFAAAPSAVREGDIPLHSLEGWPLLAEMRADPRFPALLESLRA